jgi:hypothetical protein
MDNKNTEESKFTREELELIAADREFERKLNDDELLDKLMNEPEKPLQRERFESLCFLADGGITIAGVKLPPPTAGAWLLLTLLECPLVVPGAKNDITVADFFRALYVLKNGKDAVAPLLPYQSLKAELAEQAEHAGESDQLFGVYLAKLSEVSRAKAEFDRLVLDFGSGLGRFDYVKAVVDLETYLDAAFAGFELMPRKEQPKKKTNGTKRTPRLFRRFWRWLRKRAQRRRVNCSGKNRCHASASSPSGLSKKTASKESANANAQKRSLDDLKN